MRLQHRLLAVGVALQLVASSLFAARDEPQLPAILQSGPITVALDDGRNVTLNASRTGFGMLFDLGPIVGWLGGDLEVGPLRKAHTFSIHDAKIIFGPGSPAIAFGQEIIYLDQPPQMLSGSLHVPIQLLESLYSESLGVHFAWKEPNRLEIRKESLKSVPLGLSLVHLQGVSTLVLELPERMRYSVRSLPSGVDVEIGGGKLRLSESRNLPEDPIVEKVEVYPDRVRVRLPSQVETKDYVLENPFRIVLDIFEKRSQAPTETAPAPTLPPRRAQDRPGIHTVVIDPGHGGSEDGAIGPSGSVEKELVLRLARSLERRLRSSLGVRVVLTRTNDVDLDLDARTAIANQNKADLFISLHLNSSTGARARGAETYFLNLQATDSEAARAAEVENNASGSQNELQMILWDLAQSYHLGESQEFAKIVQDELNEALGLRDRGVKQAPFRVLLGTTMPAVLVELGFISNPEEEALLNSPEYRADLVEALVRAVSRMKARLEPDRTADEELP